MKFTSKGKEFMNLSCSTCGKHKCKDNLLLKNKKWVCWRCDGWRSNPNRGPARHKTDPHHAFKHGHANSKVYNTWKNMISRCHNENDNNYSNYGGRGISVDPKWLSIENFVSDMGLPPSKKVSLDRIDFNGNYTKSNCRWADLLVQANNTRQNRFLKFNNTTMTLAQWARHLKMSPLTIRTRLYNGWSVEKALATPICQNRRNSRAKCA